MRDSPFFKDDMVIQLVYVVFSSQYQEIIRLVTVKIKWQLLFLFQKNVYLCIRNSERILLALRRFADRQRPVPLQYDT